MFDNTAAASLLHLPVVGGLIFCNSATPPLGTSFPLFHGPSIVKHNFFFKDFFKILMDGLWMNSVALLGEYGVGKTALLQAALRKMKKKGIKVKLIYK